MGHEASLPTGATCEASVLLLRDQGRYTQPSRTLHLLGGGRSVGDAKLSRTWLWLWFCWYVSLISALVRKVFSWFVEMPMGLDTVGRNYTEPALQKVFWNTKKDTHKSSATHNHEVRD
jgi:hypothetical protein